MPADGHLNFDTKIDTSGFDKGTANVEKSAEKAGKSTEKTAEKTAAEIDKILASTEKSAKAKAASIAAIYKKNGDDASVAFKKAWDQVGRSPLIKEGVSKSDSIGDNIDSTASHLKSLAKTAAIAFSSQKIIGFGKSALESAAEVNAANSQMSQTFGEFEDSATSAMEHVADASGIVKTRLQGVGTSIYAFARTSGMDVPQALSMMQDSLQVAADSAAYYDRSLEETSETLKSFLKGNYANDAALGLSATEFTRNAAAMKLYGKKFQELSEAQKQLTLLQMVKDANDLSGATGQAARESEGWENVLGNLKETWWQFMAVLGQPILRVVTVAVKDLTAAIATLTAKTQAALGAISALAGWDKTAATTQKISSSIAQSVDNQTALTDAVEATAKAQKKSLAGFDKINTLSSQTASQSGAGVSGATTLPISVTTSDALASIDDFVSKAKPLLASLKEYYDVNFSSTFDDIYSGFIAETYELRDIVARVFDDIKSLGPPLAEYFATDFTEYLQAAFAVTGDILLGLYDSFNTVFADIWSIAVFPILRAFVDDGLPVITQFCTESILTFGVLFDEIKSIFDMLWSDAAKPVLSLIADEFSDCMQLLRQFWDKWGHPLFDKIRDTLHTIGDITKKLWDNFIKPVFDSVAVASRKIWDDHLKPLLANVLDLVGTAIDAALDIYNHCIAPLVEWFADYMYPILAAVFSKLIGVAGNFVGGLIDNINIGIDALKGLINFIAGVFTGDWQRAWGGLKQYFKALWDSLVNIVKTPVNLIIDIINGMLDAVEWAINGVVDALNTLSFDVPEWVPEIGGSTLGFDIGNIDIPDIPHLAKGTVVPANFGEYHAILGDNKREPEVVSPYSTIVKAVEDALAKRGGGSDGSPIIVQCMLDGREIGRAAVKAVKDDRARSGGQ